MSNNLRLTYLTSVLITGYILLSVDSRRTLSILYFKICCCIQKMTLANSLSFRLMTNEYLKKDFYERLIEKKSWQCIVGSCFFLLRSAFLSHHRISSLLVKFSHRFKYSTAKSIVFTTIVKKFVVQI